MRDGELSSVINMYHATVAKILQMVCPDGRPPDPITGARPQNCSGHGTCMLGGGCKCDVFPPTAGASAGLPRFSYPDCMDEFCLANCSDRYFLRTTFILSTVN